MKSLGTITVGSLTPPEADVFPLFYGLARGEFAKHGVNVKVTSLTPSAGVSALYSGSIDLLFDGTGTLNEAVSTHRVEALGAYSEVPVWFVAKPSSGFKPVTKISQLTEFNGKVVGASTPGSGVTDVEQSIFAQAHAKPSFDYLGASSPVVAVAHGLVSVATATPATLAAAKADGLQIVANVTKLVHGRGLYGLIGGNVGFVNHHLRLVRAFAAAYQAAMKAANSRVSSLIPVLARNLNESAAAARESYILQKRYVFIKPAPVAEIRHDLNTISGVLPAAKMASLASVMNNNVLFK